MSHIKKFPGQKAGEHIQLLVRKHWITDVKSGALLVLLGVIPFLAGNYVLGQLWSFEGSQIFWGAVLIFLLYILFISLLTYIHWLNDELDIIVATEERIISHEQIDLFHRSISEANVSQIQDVKGVEKGFWQNILHYGTLEVMTSSQDVFFEMKYANRPYENARLLLDLRDTSITKNNLG